MKYYYILFKLLEFMGQAELLPQVPLLRTRLWLDQSGFFWKKLCGERGWIYANQSVEHRQWDYKRKLKDNV